MLYFFVASSRPKITSEIGRLGVRKRRKSIPPTYHRPSSKSLTEALSPGKQQVSRGVSSHGYEGMVVARGLENIAAFLVLFLALSLALS